MEQTSGAGSLPLAHLFLDQCRHVDFLIVLTKAASAKATRLHERLASGTDGRADIVESSSSTASGRTTATV
jgi:hypothetical protein